MKFNTLIATSMATALLSGCGSSNIDTVKDSYTYIDQTLSIGQILNNRHVCSSTEWTEFEDVRGRMIVQYKCHLTGAKEHYAAVNEQHVNNARRNAEDLVAHYQEDIKEYEAEYQKLVDKLSKFEELAKLHPEWSTAYKEETKYIVAKGATIDELSGKYPEQRYEIESYINELDKLFVHQNKFDTWTEQIEKSKRRLAETKERLSYDSKPEYIGVTEVLQWSFSNEQVPIAVWTGIQAEKQDGTYTENSLDYGEMLATARSNKQQTFLQYMAAIRFNGLLKLVQ